jgi:tripartite-type tricarboxylate transporter receptor subunit TctC
VGHSKLKIASVVTLAALLLFAPGSTSAQESYPNHPIKLIFPYVPGSLGDVLARLVAEKLTNSIRPACDRGKPSRCVG